MLASLSGSLALAIGVAVMLLPLLSPELSRPRDAVWGAVLLMDWSSTRGVFGRGTRRLCGPGDTTPLGACCA